MNPARDAGDVLKFTGDPVSGFSRSIPGQDDKGNMKYEVHEETLANRFNGDYMGRLYH